MISFKFQNPMELNQQILNERQFKMRFKELNNNYTDIVGLGTALHLCNDVFISFSSMKAK